MRRPLVIPPAARDLASRLERWWAGLSRRERILVGILGTLAVATALTLLVIRPLQSARARAVADIRTYEGLALRLRMAGPLQLQKTRGGGDPAATAATGAVTSGIAIQQSQPEAGGVRITLVDQPFDGTLRWIAELEGSAGLRIVDLRLAAAGPGRISGQLLVTP